MTIASDHHSAREVAHCESTLPGVDYFAARSFHSFTMVIRYTFVNVCRIAREKSPLAAGYLPNTG